MFSGWERDKVGAQWGRMLGEASKGVVVHTQIGRQRVGEGIKKEATFGCWRGTWVRLRNEQGWEPRLPQALEATIGGG